MKSLIECGMSEGKIRQGRPVYGHREYLHADTECPGNALMNEVRTWDTY